MRTCINYSSYTGTIYYAVGRDMQKDKDEEFDRFITAVGKYEELTPYIESQTEDSIVYRITADAAYIQMLVNKIAMISLQGCVYRDEHKKACRYCSYQNYCKVVNGRDITNG